MMMMLMLTNKPLPIIFALMQPVAARGSMVRTGDNDEWMRMAWLEGSHNCADTSTESWAQFSLLQIERNTRSDWSVKQQYYWSSVIEPPPSRKEGTWLLYAKLIIISTIQLLLNCIPNYLYGVSVSCSVRVNKVLRVVHHEMCVPDGV